jgi:hypothetical protein
MKKLTHTLSTITLGVIEVISFSSTVKAYDSINYANWSVHQRDKEDRDALNRAQSEEPDCDLWNCDSLRLLKEIKKLGRDESQQGLRMYGEFINKLEKKSEGKSGTLYSEMLNHARNNFTVLQGLYDQENFSAIQSLVLFPVPLGRPVVTGQHRPSFDVWLSRKQQ